jgi:hypothetical protein
MSTIFEIVLLAAGLSTVQPPPPADPAPIVVTGQRVPDYRTALAACLARHCPPNEDIDATLALAEALLLQGEYGDARTAVRASMSRNRREASNYPEPVSDLYRAGTRLAEHLGRDREVETYVYQILRSLQAGLPVEDHRHFTARLEIVRSLAALGQPDVAERELRRLIDVARAGGREDVAGLAELRLMWLNYLQAPHGPVRRRLVEMSQSTDPERRLLAHGARVMLIQIYSREGDTRRADAIMAEMARNGDAPRQLLYAPTYQLTQQINVEGDRHRQGTVFDVSSHRMMTANLTQRMTENFEEKWIDVGFWVQADGRVDDLQILRRSRGAGWETPLLASIGGRRYSPGPRPTYRLERYTFISTLDFTGTGTHIPDRSPRGRIEYLDLTANAQSPAQQAD